MCGLGGDDVNCGGGWQVTVWLDVCGQRAVAGQLGLDPEQRKLQASRPGLLLAGSFQRGVEIVRDTAETAEKLANPDNITTDVPVHRISLG